MKNFLLSLIPKLTVLTTKSAITAVACVATGAAVSAATTSAVYNNKVAQYEKTIEKLRSEGTQNAGEQDGSIPTEARVVDGKLEIWDGTMWVSYGPVDAVAAADPFYENSEKKSETEKSVAERKLESLGLKVDENGEIVPIDPANGATVSKTADGVMLLVGNTAARTNAKTNAKGTAKTENAASTAGPVVSNLTGVAGERTADPNLAAAPAATVTNSTWTSQPSSGGGGGGGGGDSYDGGSSGGSTGGSTGGSSGSASVSAPAASAPAASAPAVVETPSGGGGGDSGGGGGDSGGGGGDSGGGGGDSGGGDDGGGSDGDDFSEDVK